MAVATAIRGRLSRISTFSYHDRNDERREGSASWIRRQTFLVKSAGSGTSGCQFLSNFDRSSFMFLLVVQRVEAKVRFPSPLTFAGYQLLIIFMVFKG